MTDLNTAHKRKDKFEHVSKLNIVYGCYDTPLMSTLDINMPKDKSNLSNHHLHVMAYEETSQTVVHRHKHYPIFPQISDLTPENSLLI